MGVRYYNACTQHSVNGHTSVALTSFPAAVWEWVYHRSWRRMVDHGDVWLIMETYGWSWRRMVDHEGIWLIMKTYGWSWRHLVDHEGIWLIMETYGWSWRNTYGWHGNIWLH